MPSIVASFTRHKAIHKVIHKVIHKAISGSGTGAFLSISID